MRRQQILMVIAAVALIGCCIGIVVATEPEPAAKREFDQRCAACHGNEGKGDGPAAKGLAIPPADLTHLIRNADGTFPTERVIWAIDGRELRKLASSAVMPTWGQEYAREFRANPNTNLMIEKRIRQMAKHLETLQK